MDTQIEEPETLITAQDLQDILQIIDLSARRGAFEGKDLLVIGSIREKVAKAVTASAQASA